MPQAIGLSCGQGGNIVSTLVVVADIKQILTGIEFSGHAQVAEIIEMLLESQHPLRCQPAVIGGSVRVDNVAYHQFDGTTA